VRVRRAGLGFATGLDECYREWLLKNSCFVKMAGFWEIENVFQNGDRHLLGFLLQSFFDHFPVIECFNTHAI
jgi:hypothetical protein